ncbi:MAG TPA: beta-propeller fold lactonase family protein [Candidatus Binatia bacterium]|nr:beta-propeller fold lactonase family protein [Candidatus Binatia bacterium]
MPAKLLRCRVVPALFLLCIFPIAAMAGSTPSYVVTNDDSPGFFPVSATFYGVGSTGLLTLDKFVTLTGSGIAGGYFNANRVVALNSSNNQCIFASAAANGEITGISVSTLEIGGSATGSSSDTGLSNGVGLAVNNQYLYAGYTDSSNIGTFQVQSGCSLTFISDVATTGLQGGFISGMKIHGNMMVVTYGDGSIESFNIANGPPVPNGDQQNSTAYNTSQGASYPNGVDITQDGHFAIFGDTATSNSIEVSDISSGKLAATVAYNVGAQINSSNIMLSPDETLLYIANTQGDALTAAFFNATTGALTPGCTSNNLKAYGTAWSYLAGIATETNTGTGGMIYAAEFGLKSSIAMIQVASANGKCTLTESTKSPVFDPDSQGLLSITSFPPRSF